MKSLIRWLGLVVAVALLVWVCRNHEYGGVKGVNVPVPDVLSSIAFAAVATLLTRIFINTTAGKIAAPFVGGIAGVFGSGHQFYGPYGGVVGLLVGTIISLIPIKISGGLLKPKT